MQSWHETGFGREFSLCDELFEFSIGSDDLHLPIAANNSPYFVTFFISHREVRFDRLSVGLSANHYHSHSHIEAAIHFALRDGTNFFEQSENWQPWPAAFRDLHGCAGWQNSRQVIN
jgi:hypothetical protein